MQISVEGENLKFFLKIINKISQVKIIDLEDFVSLNKLLGNRFIKALEAIHQNRIKEYFFEGLIGPIFVVVGEEKDYLVIPEADYCSCRATTLGIKSKKLPCYHLIACKLSIILGLTERVEAEYEFYDKFMEEFK